MIDLKPYPSVSLQPMAELPPIGALVQSDSTMAHVFRIVRGFRTLTERVPDDGERILGGEVFVRYDREAELSLPLDVVLYQSDSRLGSTFACSVSDFLANFRRIVQEEGASAPDVATLMNCGDRENLAWNVAFYYASAAKEEQPALATFATKPELVQAVRIENDYNQAKAVAAWAGGIAYYQGDDLYVKLPQHQKYQEAGVGQWIVFTQGKFRAFHNYEFEVRFAPTKFTS